MSPTQNLLTAPQVRALLSSNSSDADKVKALAVGAPADLEATRALIAGLGGVRWKVVLACAKALGQATEACAEVAVAGLLPCLNHAYSEVRAEAGQSLGTLSLLAEVPVISLWEAFLGEEEMRAYHSVGRTLLACLRTWGYPASATWAPKAVNSCATQRPIPEPPPVTTATLPSNKWGVNTEPYCIATPLKIEPWRRP